MTTHQTIPHTIRGKDVEFQKLVQLAIIGYYVQYRDVSCYAVGQYLNNLIKNTQFK